MTVDPRAMEPGRQYPTDDGTKAAYQKPSVGRILHVRNPATGRCNAAVVTEADDVLLHVTVFLPNGGAQPLIVRTANDHDEWHWPERV